MMTAARIVVDTNVLVSAIRSRKGAAFKLISQIGTGRFEIALSVPLVLEYEDVLLRSLKNTLLTPDNIAELLDFFCTVAVKQNIFYLWRPVLTDPDDDMILELAVAAECSAIVTYNDRDFGGARQFGVRILTPQEFLDQIGV